MRRSRRSRESPRRYGGDDNVPVQGLLGIGIVTVTSLAFGAVVAVIAIVVAVVF